MTINFDFEQTLATIPDNLLSLTAAEMGLQTTFQVENDQLILHVQAGFPAKRLAESYTAALKSALQRHTALPIKVLFDSVIQPRRTQIVGKGLRGVKNTIAIASGKGGVGKSTVTVNLAAALARSGARVGILDADIYGPSIPLMLGSHEPVQVSGDKYLPIQVHGMQAMSIGYLMENNQALIWRGPMLAKSFIQMLDSTLWDNLDYLFIDLPPGTGDIQLSLVQKIPLTAAVVVTTPQQVATLDAEKAVKMFAQTGIDVLGIIENMSTHVCSHCGHQDKLFGQGGGQQLADEFHIPLLGQLPLDSRIGKDCDQGILTIDTDDKLLATIFTKAALTLAIKLAKKPLNYADKFPPIIVE